MNREISRREFVRGAATVAALSVIPLGVHAQPTSQLKVGLIGSGGRGTGAARDIIEADSGTIIWSVGDLFADRMRGALGNLADLGARVNVPASRQFVGFDAYKQVINSGVDIVILAAPPGFRPEHFKAAVEAGKHVFMEKPVAVCPTGVRMVLAASEMAAQKKLGVVAGTQRRHQRSYLETMKRVHDGAIGKIASAQCYWNQGGLWHHGRKPEWSDTEYQIRNWLYFAWLSGDHIVEQHIHNIDVINWAMNGHPVKCIGSGGRQARTDEKYGHIYDHFTIEYEYADGMRMLSTCRQIDNCASRVSEFLIGDKGVCDPGGSIRGENSWRFQGDNPNPYVQEHKDLVASIRSGSPLNEGRTVAESTLTAIMGRMAAYTGKEIAWEQALNSKLDLTKNGLAFGPMPVEAVAIPGVTQLT
ncbi:MAG: Gfo/Idh/MocA family oxidoreductase [Armatimonadetes bacterium]|nr:Gfo/Idh/MocA family oxidoreductase [Armatimonadota bacterium]